MQTLTVQLTVPKESKEIIDAIVELIADIRDKKSIPQIVAENLPGLISAVDGFDSLDEEMKSEYVSELMAYAVDRLGDVMGK